MSLITELDDICIDFFDYIQSPDACIGWTLVYCLLLGIDYSILVDEEKEWMDL